MENKTNKSIKVIFRDDKTSNYYQVEASQYHKLLNKDITRSYKKICPASATNITKEAKPITSNLKLDDRINITAKRDAYITLKDHKPNFNNNPTCRHQSDQNLKLDR